MLTQLKAEHRPFNGAAEPVALDRSEPELFSQGSTMGRELQLLLACARVVLDDTTADRIRTLMQGNIDWTYIVEQAEQHRVLPLPFHHDRLPRVSD